MKKGVKVNRDTILLVVGILGVSHETLINNTDRPTLLLLFAAMIGLPAFIKQDEKTNTPPVKPPVGDNDG